MTEKYMKNCRTAYKVAFILAVIQTVICFIIILINNSGNFALVFANTNTTFVLSFIVILSCSFDIEKEYNKYINENKKTTFIFYFILTNPILILLLSLICIPLHINLAYLLGYFCGVSILPYLIGHIYYILVFVNLKKKNYETHKEEIQLNKQEKIANENITITKNLLEKVGNIFFVKYYYELENQSLLDIMDLIKENYSEETKKERITNGKKIFEKGLEQTALSIISDEHLITDELLLQKLNSLKTYSKNPNI